MYLCAVRVYKYVVIIGNIFYIACAIEQNRFEYLKRCERDLSVSK